MNYEQAQSQLKSFKSKAKAARSEGKTAQAAEFRSAAKRLERKLRSIPKPAPAPAAEESSEEG